jgi:hypothetical protein
MIKAIETIYKGHRFRSRLEARWAVFFNSLNIKWEYEKEGYILEDDTKYLPDFWLPELNYWIEIKPETDDGKSCKDGLDIMHKFGKNCIGSAYLLCGIPDIPRWGENDSPYMGYWDCDSFYMWCECPTCGVIGLQYEGRSARNHHKENCEILLLCKEKKDHPVYGRTDDKVYNYDSPRLLMAYTAAKSARFEYGESG